MKKIIKVKKIGVNGMGWDCFGRGFRETSQERDL